MTEILLEKKLMSDFTMGFELEGIWVDDDDSTTEDIDDFFHSYFDGDLHNDISVRSYNMDIPFEYAAGPLSVTPATFDKIIKFFSEYLGEKFYTNETCGFHHHVSFPDITAEDIVWIMAHLSIDKNMREKISYFNDINFITDYSKSDYLDELADYVNDMNIRGIVKTCATDKFSLVNVHKGINTLEWRGPRGFLDRENIDEIKQFYKVLYDFIKWISNTLDEKYLNDVSKENFYEMIKPTIRKTRFFSSFNIDKSVKNELISPRILESKLTTIYMNITELYKFVKTPIVLEQIIQTMYNRDRLGTRIKKLNEDNEALPGLTTINDICYKYIPYRMLITHYNLTEDSIFNTSYKTLKRLLSTAKLDGDSVSREQIVELIKNEKLLSRIDIKNIRKMYKDHKDFILTLIKDLANICTDDELLPFYQAFKKYFIEAISYGISNKVLSTLFSNLIKANKNVAECKLLIKNVADKPEIISSIYKWIYDSISNPMYKGDKQTLLKLIPANKKTLEYLIKNARHRYNMVEFYNKFKPEMLSSHIITEKEFDSLDREIIKANREKMNSMAKEELKEPEYDTEESIASNNEE